MDVCEGGTAPPRPLGGLPPFRRPDAFLGEYRDEQGISPLDLSCVLHCVRDVLRGHGIDRTVRFIVRPVQVVLLVDTRFRPWLCSQAEEELDRPAFEQGLRASYRWTRDVTELVNAVDSMFDAGKATIVFANRWVVPWHSQSPLTQTEGHASVVVGRDAGGLFIVDRRPVGNTTMTHDLHVEPDQLRESARFGIGVLDYDLVEPEQTPVDQVRSLVRRSAENLADAPPEPQLRARGLDAVRTLRLLFREDTYRLLDSRHMRLNLRWHIGSCIQKYVMGSRVLLRAYLTLEGTEIAGVPKTIERLGLSIAAWDQLAKSFSQAGRHGLAADSVDVAAAIDAVERAETDLVDALRAVQ